MHDGRAAVDLSDVDALSFDCYGTLIDWETGIAAVLAPWAQDAGLELSDEELLLAYAENEAQAERDTPDALYPAILAEAFRRTGAALGAEVSDEWAARLGASVPDWPAFPDSAEALAALAEDYTLIIVSNVHRDGFAGSNARLGVEFDKIITAEDVQAYKPALDHFEALDDALTEFGIPRERLLHVAQSLFHDHVPAARRGLRSVWINRRHDRPGWGATPAPTGEYAYDLEFPTMQAFADAARAAKARGTAQH
ncbi:HAD-IA family hydrolase [Rhodococcus sp. (in: high G+C Gram-positive bacteria)]|uniref:HAD-IA family hydrolase n=1 Tax=Rhodococcus sp. TaxID=1831 RepID=UPI0025E51E69|nr:HAD-IA family hydrolase [Rhodococcus sp. (in: high G+C Gram-positive bacteria)]